MANEKSKKRSLRYCHGCKKYGDDPLGMPLSLQKRVLCLTQKRGVLQRGSTAHDREGIHPLSG